MQWLWYGLFLVFVFSASQGSGGGCLDRPDQNDNTNDNTPDVNVNDNDGDVNDNDVDLNDNDNLEARIELEVLSPESDNDNLNENQNSSTNGNDNFMPTPECTSNGDCDDGVFCNGEETCGGSACIAGTAIFCPFGGSCDEVAQGCPPRIDDPLPPVCPPLGPIGPRENDLGEVAPGSTIALGTDCEPTSWSASLDGMEAETSSICCWRFFIEVPTTLSEGDHVLEIRAPGMDDPVTTVRFSRGEIVIPPE